MTNNPRAYGKAQLVDDLMVLSSKAVTCKADLESWSLLARAVRERLLTAEPADLGPLPESLHDYLADAEIRLSDPDYAAAQQRIVSRLIARLQQESEPARVAFGS